MAANKMDTGRPAGKNTSRQLWPRGDVKAGAVADFQRRIIYQSKANLWRRDRCADEPSKVSEKYSALIILAEYELRITCYHGLGWTQYFPGTCCLSIMPTSI